MAIKKTFNLSTGATGDYVRLGAFTISYITRECRAEFVLYQSADNRAQKPSAIHGVIATLQLTGDVFDKYLSDAALRGTSTAAQLYRALCDEEQYRKLPKDKQPKGYVDPGAKYKALPGLGVTEDQWREMRIGTAEQA